ncbi:cobalamin-binding protein [Vogesella sp. LIG4]|uniref:cobalamin-binding protein n=1 Tax=Vogesella sp. LIG4 TaxID=1192162 RepID=UPI0008201E78|nr:cobalamin-binding protein [Vogesella sp. LIG4]SCK12026.1 vitamin B12 transport system substrate-binding protein [Vogesella sp. LIG4]
MKRLLLAACGLAALPAMAQLSVRDGLGLAVTLPHPAQRIVALSPHLVEDMYAIGAERLLVGAVDYSDYPPAARQLPRVGGYSGVSLEAVLRQKPDLVLAWRDGNNGRELTRLRELGVPVYVSAPVALPDVAAEMRRLGKLSGHVAGAEAAAGRFENGLAQLKQRYRPAAALRVFVQVGDNPLFTVSSRSFLGALLPLCGGSNVFGTLPLAAPQVSTEAVLAAKPQVMLGLDSELRRRWQAWPQLPAVRDGLLFSLPADPVSRPGPRLLQGAASVCEVLNTARRKLGLTPS